MEVIIDPGPDAEPVPWKLTAALGVGGVALLAGCVACVANPWGFVLFAGHRWVWIAGAAIGGVFCNLAVARTRPQLPFGRAARGVGLGLTALVMIAVLLGAAGVLLTETFLGTVRETTIRVDADTVLVRRQVQYGMGPDSSCIQFEVRRGIGLLARFREVGHCMDPDHGWTAAVDGDVLTLTVGTSTTCTYRIDGAAMTLEPLATKGCERFGV